MSGSTGLVVVPGLLVALVIVGALSLATQPPSLATVGWWPNAGIALGLGIRYSRRYAWALGLAVAAVTAPTLICAGRPAALAVALSLSMALEMVIGTVLLRGRRDELPMLTTPRELARFLVIVLVAAGAYDLVASTATLLLGDPAEAWSRFETTIPRHAAGMVLITPLLMGYARRPFAAGMATAAQVVVTLAVTVYVFVVNELYPLAFLPFVPLVWAAIRMSTRLLVAVMMTIAVIATVGSALDSGPFSFARLGDEAGALVLQIFQICMAVVFLALSLVVAQERDTAARLYASEDLFRKSFDSSVAGKLIVLRRGSVWTVQRSNSSAAELLPELSCGPSDLAAVLGLQAVDTLSAAADSRVDGGARVTLSLPDGRSLYVSVAPITDQGGDTVYALHFHDVTEALRVRQLEQDEFKRAAEIQRALTPERLVNPPGWSCAASSRPARHVGGDFYDVRFDVPNVVLTVGDVMGKGVGAGMLAAATRTALRAQASNATPAVAVRTAADILDRDLRRASAFITLGHVLVDLRSGDFRFVDAGHGLQFVLRADSGAVTRLSSDGMPIGLDQRWAEGSGTLAPGDTIVLVSDGVLDLWDGSVIGLEDAIAGCAQPAGVDPQKLVDALCTVADEDPDRDDVTAVALCRHPSPGFATTAARPFA